MFDFLNNIIIEFFKINVQVFKNISYYFILKFFEKTFLIFLKNYIRYLIYKYYKNIFFNIFIK